MGKPVSILKNKLFWVIAALLLFWIFPRPVKWAGRFLFSKFIPNMALMANIISTFPLHKLRKSQTDSEEIESDLSPEWPREEV
jgi:hypothetical protein